MKFTERYINLVRNSTDAPEVFAEAMGYFLLSCAAGRKLFMRRGTYVVYPGMWLILFGPTTAARKSTSMDYPLSLLAEINGAVELPSGFSVEALADYLKLHPTGFLKYDEFANLSTSFKRDYLRGLQGKLTELWGCPNVWKLARRPKMGKDGEMVDQDTIVNEPFVNIVAATTIDWFSKTTDESDAHGGFLPRFVMVPAEHQREFKASPEPVDQRARAEVVAELAKAACIDGEVVFSPKAKEDFDRAAEAVNAMIRQRGDPFYARLNAHLERFCILEAMNLGEAPLVTPEAVAGARSWITNCVLWMDRLRKQIPNGREDEMKVRVYKQIPADGTAILRGALLGRTNMLGRTLEPVLDSLSEQGLITIKRLNPTAQGGRPGWEIRRVLEVQETSMKYEETPLPGAAQQVS